MEKLLVLFDLDYTLFNTDLFKTSGFAEHEAYPEAVKVLEALRRGKVGLGIFSEGDEALQNEKMRKANISRFFSPNNVNIVINKKEAMVKILKKHKDKKVFLVDDRRDMLMLAKKADSSLTAIWVENGPYAKSQKEDSYKADFNITDLTEIVGIIL